MGRGREASVVARTTYLGRPPSWSLLVRIRRAVAAIVTPALLLAACADDEEPEESGNDEPAGPQEPDELDDLGVDEGAEPAAAIDPPEVELVDAGDEPRRALRLDLEEGTEVSATLQFEEEVLTEDDGTPQPPQAGQVELRLTVTEVDDGETTLAFTYDAVAMDGQDGAGNPLEGVEGEMVLDDRSRLIATTQSAQGLDQLPIALPEEEVGEGAVWEVRIEGVFDLPATEIMTVELTSLDDDEYELSLDATTQGPGEPTPMPGASMEPGAELVLEDLQRTSTGQQRASLTTPFPISSSLATETVLVISLADEAADEDELGPDLAEEQTQHFREQIEFERD
jgi:hypothetical protein